MSPVRDAATTCAVAGAVTIVFKYRYDSEAASPALHAPLYVPRNCAGFASCSRMNRDLRLPRASRRDTLRINEVAGKSTGQSGPFNTKNGLSSRGNAGPRSYQNSRLSHKKSEANRARSARNFTGQVPDIGPSVQPKKNVSNESSGLGRTQRREYGVGERRSDYAGANRSSSLPVPSSRRVLYRTRRPWDQSSAGPIRRATPEPVAAAHSPTPAR